MNNVEQFIDLVGQGENTEAQQVLNGILSTKAFDALGEIKQNIAQSLFIQPDEDGTE